MITHSIPLEITAETIEAIRSGHERKAAQMREQKLAAATRGDLDAFRSFRRAERDHEAMAEAYRQVVPA